MYTRTRSLIAFALLLLAQGLHAGTPAIASPPPEAQELIRDNLPSMRQEMRKDPLVWGLTSADDAPNSYGRAYLVYGIDWSHFSSRSTTAVASLNGSLRPLTWEYPLLSPDGEVVGSAQVLKSDTGWEYGLGLYIPTDMVALSADESALRDAFARAGIRTRGELKHVRVEPLAIDYVIGRDGSLQYELLLADAKGGLGLSVGSVTQHSVFTEKVVSALTEAARQGAGGRMGSVGGQLESTVESEQPVRALVLWGIMAAVGVLIAFWAGMQRKRVRGVD